MLHRIASASALLVCCVLATVRSPVPSSANGDAAASEESPPVIEFQFHVVRDPQRPPPPPPPPPPPLRLHRSTRQTLPDDDPGLARSAQVVRRCEDEGPACGNGGHCDTFFPMPAGAAGLQSGLDSGLVRLACMCPIGYTGARCETEGNFRFPEFHGNGHLTFELDQFDQVSLTVSLEILPRLHNGILLYAIGKQTFGDQFLALVLRDRKPQFRYNNGDGMSVLTFPHSLDINVWHTVSIHRGDKVIWIQVNSTRRAVSIQSGASPSPGDIFRDLGSKFHLGNRLYVAGFPRSVTAGQLATQTDSDAGFVGCLGNVTLNRRVLDPRRKPFHGHAIGGSNVYDCAMATCRQHRCRNRGQCHVTRPPSEYVCLCVNATGRFCESPIKSPVTIPKFDGSGHARLRGGGPLRGTSRSRTDLTVTFRPEAPNGLILYAGYSRDTRGDFLAVGLVNQRAVVAFDLGSGPVVIRSRHNLDLYRWTTVEFRRVGRQGRLRVSGQAGEVEGYSPGGLVQLDIRLDTCLGGHGDYEDVSEFLPVRTNFVGCLQSLSFGDLGRVEFPRDLAGGVNYAQCGNHSCSEERDACGPGGECVIDNAAGVLGYACRCRLGFSGPRCDKELSKRDIGLARFKRDGFLLYRDQDLMSRRTRP